MLDTVRVHPMLVTANKENEVHSARYVRSFMSLGCLSAAQLLPHTSNAAYTFLYSVPAISTYQFICRSFDPIFVRAAANFVLNYFALTYGILFSNRS